MDDEVGVDEFGLDDEGRLSLFGQPTGDTFAVDESGLDDEGRLVLVDAWEDCGDGPEAWLRSLPPGLRAEVEARPPVTALPWEAGPQAARASFADGGLGDAMLPGPVLGQLLGEATVDGYAGMSDDQLAGVLRGWQRQVAHDQANLAVAVGCLAGRRAAGSSRAAEHVTDELAVELTLTGRSAARLRDLVSGLERLPEVNDALLSGFIDWGRACVFVDELAVLDGVTAAGIAEQLADRAAGWTTGQLRAALARAVLAADPLAAARRRTAARKETRVELWREGSGNAALAGRELRPSAAILLDRKLDADADWLAACGVPGTKGELRVLAYTTLLSGRDLASVLDDPATWPDAPASDASSDSAPSDGAPGDGAPGDGMTGRDDAGGRAGRGAAGPEPVPGSIHLTMPLAALAGGGEPGEVTGYGPAAAGTSRELAALLAADPATRWCLTLTGVEGRAVAHACAPGGPAPGQPAISWAAGLRERLLVLESDTCRHARESAGYVPPPRLRHLMTVRQRRCAFPGCRQPARRCDLDHTTAYDHGGRTCECNLAPLCRRHHRAKQAPGWQLTQDQPGVMTWRLPSGRIYQTTGPPYPG